MLYQKVCTTQMQTQTRLWNEEPLNKEGFHPLGISKRLLFYDSIFQLT